MYTPKKLKWNSLCEFRDYLLNNTGEKVAYFNGHRLITETTEYNMVDSLLKIYPAPKKIEEPVLRLGPRPIEPKKKKPKEVVKPKSKKDILAEMRERGKKVLDKKKKK